MLLSEKNGKITKLRDYVVRGDEAEEDIAKHSVALLRSAMPVYHELKMIKQNMKAQATKYKSSSARDRMVKLNRPACWLCISAIFY